MTMTHGHGGLQRREEGVGARPIRFVHAENIGDFHETRLHDLDFIPALGYEHDHNGIHDL